MDILLAASLPIGSKQKPLEIVSVRKRTGTSLRCAASVDDRTVRGKAFILDLDADWNIIGTSARRLVKIGLKALKEIEVVRLQAAEKLAEETLRGEVDAVVAFHQGDSRAAITTLLLDCHHLRLQLALRDKDVSRGMSCERTTRFERP
ncbi:hypothetical protein [Rhizobium esperanzae]|uniref:hypothetical protein n=1 Tax=Rhizobium esperanzae TaxID=1967781 RepID=UPI001FDA0096|nr:hypothetical protein [Rhizobium esperanzae]